MAVATEMPSFLTNQILPNYQSPPPLLSPLPDAASSSQPLCVNGQHDDVCDDMDEIQEYTLVGKMNLFLQL